MNLAATARRTIPTLAVAAPTSTTLQADEAARIRATLARVDIFRDLPREAIEDLSRRVRLRRVLGGAPVFQQDDAGDALYIILAGRVKIVMTGGRGREVTLAVLRPTEIFGELALFDGSARSAAAVAIDPTTVLALTQSDLTGHLTAHPRTAMRLLGELSRRLRRANEAIAELALLDVHERLVRRLVKLARDDAEERPDGFVIRRKPTQSDLASMVGACRETVSRAVNQLVRRGLLENCGRSMVVKHEVFRMASASSLPL